MFDRRDSREVGVYDTSEMTGEGATVRVVRNQPEGSPTNTTPLAWEEVARTINTNGRSALAKALQVTEEAWGWHSISRALPADVTKELEGIVGRLRTLVRQEEKQTR